MKRPTKVAEYDEMVGLQGDCITYEKDIDNNINGYMYDFQYNSMRSKK